MTNAYPLNALQHAARALALIPSKARSAILMRHAERPDFAKGDHGNDVLLTTQGEEDSATMGELFRERNIRLLHSPVPRCRQTAVGIGNANHSPPEPKESLPLRCDAYVEDFEKALATLSRLVDADAPYDAFVERLSKEKYSSPYPHFRPPLLATAQLMAGLLPDQKDRVCIGITHDWLINVAASHATGVVTERENYVDFLDALFLWEADSLCYYHKGRTGKCPADFQELFVQALENNGPK